MSTEIPQELVDRVMEVLKPSNLVRIEDLYVSEKREIVDPEVQETGNGGSPQWAQPLPTGTRRFSLYVRYTVLEEEKAYKERESK